MKRFLPLFLALSLLFCTACGAKEDKKDFIPIITDESVLYTPAPTPEPTPVPTPVTTAAAVLVDNVPAVLCLLSRGDTVELVESRDSYYIVKVDAGYGLMDKSILRETNILAPDPWVITTLANAKLYTSYQLSGSPAEVLPRGTQLIASEKLGKVYMVQYNGGTYFLSMSDINFEAASSAPAGGGTGSSGETGSGSSGSDGGDIVIGAYVSGGHVETLGYTVKQEGTPGERMRVLVDNAPVLLALLDRVDKVSVLSADDETAIIYLKGMTASVERRLLRLQGEEEYAPWLGYTKGNTEFFDSWLLCGEAKELLALNTEVIVLLDLGDCCYVSRDDVRGFVRRECVSPQRTSGSFSYTPGSGSSGGESSSGSGSSGEWTAPVL